MMNIIVQVFTLFLLFFYHFQKGCDAAALFTITNNCENTVWPGILADAGKPELSTTGFTLKPGESKTLLAPTSWSGRFWGRTFCSQDDNGRFFCISGDCGSSAIECSGGHGFVGPATFAVFTLNGEGGLDFYSVSLSDGYNLAIAIVPQADDHHRDGRSAANPCRSSTCELDLVTACPTELQVALGNERNGVTAVACRSACEATGKLHSKPKTCRPNPYSEFFKSACPNACTNDLDDGPCKLTCVSPNYYNITFCPKPLISYTERAKLGRKNLRLAVPQVLKLTALVAFALAASVGIWTRRVSFAEIARSAWQVLSSMLSKPGDLNAGPDIQPDDPAPDAPVPQ